MQPYKEYFISANAMLVHPFSPDWYVGGDVYVSGAYSSIVEVARFQLGRFTVSIKELAEWFGLQAAQIAVDECLAPPARLPADSLSSRRYIARLKK